ncbi:MAG: hypothetical protein KAI06_01505, partial [Anaerolineales bacterium]|nr:hypothetical protein [Anaerolineales bacterium]
ESKVGHAEVIEVWKYQRYSYVYAFPVLYDLIQLASCVATWLLYTRKDVLQCSVDFLWMHLLDLTRVNLDKNILNIIACGLRQVFLLKGTDLPADRTIR